MSTEWLPPEVWRGVEGRDSRFHVVHDDELGTIVQITTSDGHTFTGADSTHSARPNQDIGGQPPPPA